MDETRPGTPLVDYERAAEVYDPGRALSAGSMARWRDAVRARLPEGPLRCVVDVGAGTGLFLPLWAELGAEAIVAVEPSAPMRAKAAARGAERVRLLAGTAAQLGVATGSADVVWLSAVVHHVPDLAAATREWRRVLRPAGRVLVRGFFPDASTVPWLDALPGAVRARARFPSLARLTDVLAQAGFARVAVDAVPEPEGPLAREAAAWIAAMRDADSLLTALRADEIDRGIAALCAQGERRLEPMCLTLLTARAA